MQAILHNCIPVVPQCFIHNCKLKIRLHLFRDVNHTKNIAKYFAYFYRRDLCHGLKMLA